MQSIPRVAVVFLFLAASVAHAGITITVPSGYSYIANPLNNSSGNTLDVVLPNVPDGTQLLTWNCALQAFNPPDTYYSAFGWVDEFLDPSTAVLAPGGGAVIINPSFAFNVTFTGSPAVPAFPPSNYCGCNKLSLLSCQSTNLAGTFENITGSPAQTGDQVRRWNINSQSYDVYNHNGTQWTPSTPIANIGESVYVLRACAPVITSIRFSSANLIINASSEAGSITSYMLASPSIAAPLSNWTVIATNHFDGSGFFSFTNAISPGTTQQFYRYKVLQ